MRCRHSLPLLAAAMTVLLSCGTATPPPPTTEPTDAAPVTEPEPEPAPEPTPPSPEEEAAKQRAELEKQIAEGLARAEAEAEEVRKRWTPELVQEVTALTNSKPKNAKTQLQKVLASEHRAPGNADRDRYRHPLETLTFFGLEPNMKVFEVGQGAGWYTEILAPFLAHSGKLYLAGFDANAEDPRTQFNAKRIALMLESHGNLYEKIELVPQGPQGEPLALGPEGSLDAVIVFRMLHNYHRFQMWDHVLPSIFAALKPGGVLAIEQHRAPDDANPDESAKAGYLPERWVIEKIESYGFALADKSELNANPADTKDYEEGVWTLPPTLALGEKDRDKYLAIGESDRMTLKFVKPKPKRETPAKAGKKAAE